MPKRKSTAERKQAARDYVDSIDTIRKAEDLTLEAACKKAGKGMSGYYYNLRVLNDKKKTKAPIAAKVIVKRRRRSNLPALTGTVAGIGFTEIPEPLRRATGGGKMLLAVAVGDAQEVTKALEHTLSRFFN